MERLQCGQAVRVPEQIKSQTAFVIGTCVMFYFMYIVPVRHEGEDTTLMYSTAAIRSTLLSVRGEIK